MGRVTSDVVRGMSVTQSVRVGHIANLTIAGRVAKTEERKKERRKSFGRVKNIQPLIS